MPDAPRSARRRDDAPPSDLLIIGGGPAGTAAALAARGAGLDVVLLEASRGPVRKVCGEFLSEPGFHLWLRLTGAPATPHPRISRVDFRRGQDGTIVSSLPLDPVAHGVRRAVLDEELLCAATRAGVRVVRGARARRPVRLPCGSWRVEERVPSDQGATPVCWTARRIVRATGRPVIRAGGWFGVRGAAAHVTDPDRLEMTLLADGSYYGRSAVDGGGATLCGLSRVARNPWSGDDAPGPDDEILRGTPRFRPGMPPPDPDGALCVGDALAAWPPLVGDGMTVALRSGTLLGRALGRAPHLDDRAWRRIWRAHFGARLAATLRLHDLLTSPRWGGATVRLLATFPGAARRVAHLVRRHACDCPDCAASADAA